MTASKTFRNLDERKQEAVLDTALAEFAEHGYHQASVNRMAKRLDIAKGSFFKYFASKEGMFRHVFDHCVQLFSAPLRQAREQSRGLDLFSRVELSLSAGLTFLKRHPLVYRLYLKMLFQERFPMRETLLKEVRLYSAKYLRSLVRDAMESGELRPGLDPDVAVFFLDAVMDRFLQAHAVDFLDADLGLHGGDEQRSRQCLEAVVDMLRNGLAREHAEIEAADA